MRAAIIDSPHAMHVASDIPMPRAGMGQVVVRNKAVGICAGDIYIYQGKNPYAKMPAIGGHEIAGTVHEVGAGVAGIAEVSSLSSNHLLAAANAMPAAWASPTVARICRSSARTCPVALQSLWLPRPKIFTQCQRVFHLLGPASPSQWRLGCKPAVAAKSRQVILC